MPHFDVAALRPLLYAHGYRPIAYRTETKCSYEPGWQIGARCDPPLAVTRRYDPGLSNTGILADGLIPIDIDLPDPDQVSAVAEYCFANFGAPLVRQRFNTSKRLLLYCAESGFPAKRWIKNESGDLVEILGYGNQFLAFGRHPSGAPIQWLDDESPATVPVADLVPVTQDQISDLLRFIGALIGAVEKTFEPISPLECADDEVWPWRDVASALDYIENAGRDWHRWFAIASAVHAVTGGSTDGLDLFNDWAAQSQANRPANNIAKWNSLSRSRLAFHGGGTLTHYARLGRPDWIRPSRGLMDLPIF